MYRVSRAIIHMLDYMAGGPGHTIILLRPTGLLPPSSPYGFRFFLAYTFEPNPFSLLAPLLHALIYSVIGNDFGIK